MSFHEIRLPEFISPFIICIPSFSTSIIKTSSGREIRSADCGEQISKYLIKGCRLSQEQFEIFNGFFKARQGQKFSFLLHDQSDCSVRNQLLFKTTQKNRLGYFLYKIYDDLISPIYKIINHPIANTVKISTYQSNNSLIEFALDCNEIKFSSQEVSYEEIHVSFDFNIEVRFNQDHFNYALHPDGSIAISDIELIEILY